MTEHEPPQTVEATNPSGMPMGITVVVPTADAWLLVEKAAYRAFVGFNVPFFQCLGRGLEIDVEPSPSAAY